MKQSEQKRGQVTTRVHSDLQDRIQLQLHILDIYESCDYSWVVLSRLEITGLVVIFHAVLHL